jgi:hypothetical protein
MKSADYQAEKILFCTDLNAIFVKNRIKIGLSNSNSAPFFL